MLNLSKAEATVIVTYLNITAVSVRLVHSFMLP